MPRSWDVQWAARAVCSIRQVCRLSDKLGDARELLESAIGAIEGAYPLIDASPVKHNVRWSMRKGQGRQLQQNTCLRSEMGCLPEKQKWAL